MSEGRRLRLAAPAKINLVLDLLGSREDGYTEIATVYQTVELADEVTVSVAEGPDRTVIEAEGLDLPPERNLAWRAAEVYRRAAGWSGGIRIALRKRIPEGAGLGGGSSDAAAVLVALEELAGRRLGKEALRRLASRLGADVPFLLEGGLAIGRGRGDELEPLPDWPRPLPVVLARLGPPLSTAEVYARARLTPRRDPPKIQRFLDQLRAAPRRLPPVGNMLFGPAAELRPAIRRLVQRLAEAGGRAAMTGSGSAVFGLFAAEEEAAAAARALAAAEPEAWVCLTRTLPRGGRARAGGA